MATIKEFKEQFTVGRKIRLVSAEVQREGVWEPQTTHKAVGLLREVNALRSKDIVFKMLEGEKAGVLSYLTTPKASELENVTSEGFSLIIDYDTKVMQRLTYKWEA